MISVNHNLFFQSTDSQPFSFRLWFAQLFDHKKTYSWASGESISSHYLKLRDFFAKTDPTITLEARNVAYAGAMSSDLARQATVLVSIWKNEKFNVVPYITLLIGANDVCLDTQYGTVSDAQVSAHILGFFKILSTIHQDEPIHVLISSIPKIPDLGSPAVLNNVLPSKLTCEQVQIQRDQLCNPLTVWNSPEQYQKNVSVIAHYNALLQALAVEVPALYPQFQVAYSDAFYHQAIVVDHLAKDCFHPNRSGQLEISDRLWDDQPWWHP
jgi:lysophospholipase L1-like esterase